MALDRITSPFFIIKLYNVVKNYFGVYFFEEKQEKIKVIGKEKNPFQDILRHTNH